MSVFGLAALGLAAVGLYGSMASLVRERTRELGIRMALGAAPERLRGEVLMQALKIAGAGAVVGIATAIATSKLLSNILFEVSPADPLALAMACAVLLVVIAIAAYGPARRATKIDPQSRSNRTDPRWALVYRKNGISFTQWNPRLTRRYDDSGRRRNLMSTESAPIRPLSVRCMESANTYESLSHLVLSGLFASVATRLTLSVLRPYRTIESVALMRAPRRGRESTPASGIGEKRRLHRAVLHDLLHSKIPYSEPARRQPSN